MLVELRVHFQLKKLHPPLEITHATADVVARPPIRQRPAAIKRLAIEDKRGTTRSAGCRVGAGSELPKSRRDLDPVRGERPLREPTPTPASTSTGVRNATGLKGRP